MTNTEADYLIATLPKPSGFQIYREGGAWIHMIGPKDSTGEISVYDSAEQLLTRWKAFVAQHAVPAIERLAPAPVVGQWVSFPSKSAKSGWRRGQVVEVTPKRVLIAFRFDYERKSDQKGGLEFDPSNARTTWRKLTEIKAR